MYYTSKSYIVFVQIVHFTKFEVLNRGGFSENLEGCGTQIYIGNFSHAYDNNLKPKVSVEFIEH